MIKIKTDNMNPFLVIALAVFGIVGAPLLTIAALNTLFPLLVIPYTFSTWFATVFLVSVFSFGKNK